MEDEGTEHMEALQAALQEGKQELSFFSCINIIVKIGLCGKYFITII